MGNAFPDDGKYNNFLATVLQKTPCVRVNNVGVRVNTKRNESAARVNEPNLTAAVNRLTRRDRRIPRRCDRTERCYDRYDYYYYNRYY